VWLARNRFAVLDRTHSVSVLYHFLLTFHRTWLSVSCLAILDELFGILSLISLAHFVACSVLFCSLAVLDPRVGHTMDVLSPFISVLCHAD